MNERSAGVHRGHYTGYRFRLVSTIVHHLSASRSHRYFATSFDFLRFTRPLPHSSNVLRIHVVNIHAPWLNARMSFTCTFYRTSCKTRFSSWTRFFRALRIVAENNRATDLPTRSDFTQFFNYHAIFLRIVKGNTTIFFVLRVF